MNEKNQLPGINKRKEEMVERLGVFFEHKGFPRIQGKVFAFLLVSDPPHQDFFEIQSFLKASKSSISVALNTLLDKGVIKYITFSGDRRRYFKVDPKGWREAINRDIRRISDLNTIMKDILKTQADNESKDFYEGLKKTHQFHLGLSKVLFEYLDNWESQFESTI